MLSEVTLRRQPENIQGAVFVGHQTTRFRTTDEEGEKGRKGDGEKGRKGEGKTNTITNSRGEGATVMKIVRHQQLDVYKKSVDLAMRIFELTKNFPREELYSLTDQIRRSSRSVCANLAEA